MRYLITALLGIAPLFCDSEIALVDDGAKDERVIVKELRGVLLVSSHSEVSRMGVRNTRNFETKNVEVPGGLQKLNDRLAPQFIGKPVTKNQLTELKHELILFYRDAGYPVLSVEIPDQNVNNGTVQFVVIEGKLGVVTVRGNDYFSSSVLEGYIHQRSGEPIDTNELINDVAWINRNQFRQADLLFAAGKQPGTTDIDLIVKDRFPLRVYAGADNTGFGPTGNARWFTGFNWGNAFWLDHTLTYQFTMSTDYRSFWGHTVNYTAPLSWRHVLTVFGGYSHIHPDIRNFHSTGHNGQASLRYDIPFKPTYTSFTHQISLGFDYKNMNNILEFVSEPGNIPVAEHEVNLTQLYFGYNLNKRWDTNRMVFYAEGFWSPGKWIGDQKNSNFAQLHPGAKNHWIYGRVSIEDTWTLPLNFAIWGEFRGQISNQNLVPSEQFGLGGYNTVRGYPERIANFDDAIVANVEVRLPPFLLFCFSKQYKDELTLLGFFDYGTGRNAFAKSYEEQWQHLMGAGPALRYRIANYLSIRVDWGFKLHATQFAHRGNKVHLGLIASY